MKKEYSIYIPTSGGKAGRGYNQTVTLQIRESLGASGFFIAHKILYKVNDVFGRQKAIAKAETWIRERNQQEIKIRLKEILRAAASDFSIIQRTINEELKKGDCADFEMLFEYLKSQANDNKKSMERILGAEAVHLLNQL